MALELPLWPFGMDVIIPGWTPVNSHSRRPPFWLKSALWGCRCLPASAARSFQTVNHLKGEMLAIFCRVFLRSASDRRGPSVKGSPFASKSSLNFVWQTSCQAKPRANGFQDSRKLTKYSAMSLFVSLSKRLIISARRFWWLLDFRWCLRWRLAA